GGPTPIYRAPAARASRPADGATPTGIGRRRSLPRPAASPTRSSAVLGSADRAQNAAPIAAPPTATARPRLRRHRAEGRTELAARPPEAAGSSTETAPLAHALSRSGHRGIPTEAILAP